MNIILTGFIERTISRGNPALPLTIRVGKYQHLKKQKSFIEVCKFANLIRNSCISREAIEWAGKLLVQANTDVSLPPYSDNLIESIQGSMRFFANDRGGYTARLLTALAKEIVFWTSQEREAKETREEFLRQFYCAHLRFFESLETALQYQAGDAIDYLDSYWIIVPTIFEKAVERIKENLHPQEIADHFGIHISRVDEYWDQPEEMCEEWRSKIVNLARDKGLI